VTHEEFIAALERTPRTWQLMKDGRIRCFRNGKSMCPISSLVNRPCGKFWKAANRLHIDRLQTIRYIAAADDGPEAETELRSELLKACGLPKER
jgi:hypothetical protein